MTIDALGFIPAPIAEDFSIQHDSSESLLTGKTFADIAIFAKAVPGFTKKQCDDARSALRMLFKKTGTHPGDVPLNQPEAALDGLFHRLDAVLVAPKGPAKRNIKSRCRTVMRRYLTYIGYVAPVPAPPLVVPEPWRHIAKAIPRPTGFSPKRFIEFCTARSVAPADVDDAVMQEFTLTLHNIKHPHIHLRHLVRGWNELLGSERFAGLQTLSKDPSRRRNYSARLEDLSAALQEDIAAYMESRQTRGFGGIREVRRSGSRKVLRDSSAAKSVQLIRQYLGLLYEDGVDIAAFQSLKDAVTLDMIEQTTKALQRRTGSETSSQLNNMLSTISAMAGKWLGWAKEDRELLLDWWADYRHGYDGMVERNVARLLVLKDPRQRRALLHLPFVLFDLAARSGSERGGYLAQIGLAIELLLQVPVRVGTLSRLRWGREIITSGTGRGSCTFMVVSREGVKNSEPVHAELPPETVELLQLY